ncbi:hypothetical protein NC652_005237 [Populus alba x Populus x berolinensis]|nr:hypothetical protein NC652_005237 [Populus alba x Populus x berolinensis]
MEVPLSITNTMAPANKIFAFAFNEKGNQVLNLKLRAMLLNLVRGCSASKKHQLLAMARLIRQWPFLLTASNRNAHFRSRGPEKTSDFGQGGNASDSDSESYKSRKQKKCEARLAVRWGMELASFSPPQIKRIIKVASLEKDVFDALMLVKGMLRDVETELMDALIHGENKIYNNRGGGIISSLTTLNLTLFLSTQCCNGSYCWLPWQPTLSYISHIFLSLNSLSFSSLHLVPIYSRNGGFSSSFSSSCSCSQWWLPSSSTKAAGQCTILHPAALPSLPFQERLRPSLQVLAKPFNHQSQLSTPLLTPKDHFNQMPYIKAYNTPSNGNFHFQVRQSLSENHALLLHESPTLSLKSPGSYPPLTMGAAH